MPFLSSRQYQQTESDYAHADDDTDSVRTIEPVSESSRWTELVERIQHGERSAMEDLYRAFSRGVRFHLCKHVAREDLDDRIHDVFVIVVQAIRNGSLREPERLMGFIRTVVRRQVAASIGHAIQQRNEHAELEVCGRIADIRNDPEQQAIRDSRLRLMLQALGSIADRDREILVRYYLYEQTQEQICREMSLSDTQFRLLKSRAKAKFGEAGKRNLGRSLIKAFRIDNWRASRGPSQTDSVPDSRHSSHLE